MLVIDLNKLDNNLEIEIGNYVFKFLGDVYNNRIIMRSFILSDKKFNIFTYVTFIDSLILDINFLAKIVIDKINRINNFLHFDNLKLIFKHECSPAFAIIPTRVTSKEYNGYLLA